jgi:hypothetical protein
MKRIMIVALLAFLLTGCEKFDKDCPDCIIKKTREFMKGPTSDTGASVTEWLFQGDYVYMFDPGTRGADFSSAILNQDCEHIGSLGGNTGAFTINGVNFYQNATKIKTIWEHD